MARLVERWITIPKVVGSNSTSVEVFGLRLFTLPWRKTLPLKQTLQLDREEMNNDGY